MHQDKKAHSELEAYGPLFPGTFGDVDYFIFSWMDDRDIPMLRLVCKRWKLYFRESVRPFCAESYYASIGALSCLKYVDGICRRTIGCSSIVVHTSAAKEGQLECLKYLCEKVPLLDGIPFF